MPASDKKPQEEPTQLNVAHGLAAVGLTLPGFWPQNPDAWFVKVEAQFRNARIVCEETCFYKVLAVLPESAVIRVREITQKAQFEAGDYGRLKSRLILSCQPSTLERLDRLCEMKNVAHKKPSESLLELENILHSADEDQVIPTTDFIKKFWWLRALPTSIQQTLLPVVEKTPLASLVPIADQMYSSNPPVDRIAEIRQEHQCADVGEKPAMEFPWENGQIESNVAAIAGKFKNSRPQRRERQLLQLCKYHVKFGDNARRCVIGCSKYESQSKN